LPGLAPCRAAQGPRRSAGLTAGGLVSARARSEERPVCYDCGRVGDTMLALMTAATFFWVFETRRVNRFWAVSSTSGSASSSGAGTGRTPCDHRGRGVPSPRWFSTRFSIPTSATLGARQGRNRSAVRYLPATAKVPENGWSRGLLLLEYGGVPIIRLNGYALMKYDRSLDVRKIERGHHVADASRCCCARDTSPYWNRSFKW